ncbi:hypothetical protein ES705_15138 [subsurface metagenome]
MDFKYIIKKLTKADLTDLEGFIKTLSNLSSVGSLNLKKAKKILLKINSQNGHIYIAKRDYGEVIGATSLLIEQKFIHEGGKVGHIEDVCIKKEYEGKGIGSALVKKAIEYAKKFDCYKVILDCKDNLVPFYEKLDFYKHENCMRLDLK